MWGLLRSPNYFVSFILSSQVLVDDFSSCGGYRFLYEYLLFLEKKEGEDPVNSKEAIRNMVLLISNLVCSGFDRVELPVFDLDPLQDEAFTVPVPIQTGMCMFVRACACLWLFYKHA